jgi:hypothetical protein
MKNEGMNIALKADVFADVGGTLKCMDRNQSTVIFLGIRQGGRFISERHQSERQLSGKGRRRGTVPWQMGTDNKITRVDAEALSLNRQFSRLKFEDAKGAMMKLFSQPLLKFRC